ncbi:uncharacterized protein LOC110176856 [Drosophila serrata]|uniref:uncharacterized protein LOC110176856 n=1 Tax=Drosophila serrata TaxID=7274 RepID=UPI000A1D393C|nr:uncharacterized protein LOC110176856 [Drosophila serrata]
MSCFRKSVEYFIEIIKTKSWWRKTKQIWQESTRLDGAFYFLDLEQGCLLIALFGALVSFVKICWIYYLVYRSDTRSLFPDPIWVFLMFKDKKQYFVYHHTHYQFHVGRNLVSILNSTLLFWGVKWAYVVFLYYWIHIAIFTWAMEFYNMLFDNFKLSQMFLFMLPTFGLQAYFIVIVISLIWKLGEKPNSKTKEIQEPTLELMK